MRRSRATALSCIALAVALAGVSLAGPSLADARAGTDARAGADARAYTAEERAVLAAAEGLLDIINTRDGAAARRLLLPDGALVRVIPTVEGGEPQAIPHREFMHAIGLPGPAMHERMWEPEVLIHGPIAMVWTSYDFHVDGEFSHCGINGFSLVQSNGEWQVAGVIYTVEEEGCPPSPLGPPELH